MRLDVTREHLRCLTPALDSAETFVEHCQPHPGRHVALKPGQHFVASIANILQPPQPVFDQRKYGFSFRLMDETLHEGARLRGTLFLGEKTVEFDFYWLPWEAYEEAFRTRGIPLVEDRAFPDPAGLGTQARRGLLGGIPRQTVGDAHHLSQIAGQKQGSEPEPGQTSGLDR